MDNMLDEFLMASDKLFAIYLGMAHEIKLTKTLNDVEKLGALTESYLEVLDLCCGNSLLQATGDFEHDQIQQYTNVLRNDYQDILLNMLQA